MQAPLKRCQPPPNASIVMASDWYLKLSAELVVHEDCQKHQHTFVFCLLFLRTLKTAAFGVAFKSQRNNILKSKNLTVSTVRTS